MFTFPYGISEIYTVSFDFVNVLILRVVYHTYWRNGVKKLTLYLLHWTDARQEIHINIYAARQTYHMLPLALRLTPGKGFTKFFSCPSSFMVWMNSWFTSSTKKHTRVSYHLFPRLFWSSATYLEILETGRCNRWPASTSILTLYIQINIWKGKHILQAVAVTHTPHMPSLKYSVYSPVSFWIYLITYAITWKIARESDSFEPSYFTQKRVILWTIRLHGSQIVLSPFS